MIDVAFTTTIARVYIVVKQIKDSFTTIEAINECLISFTVNLHN